MDDITQRLTDAVQGKMPITFAMLIEARTEIERLRIAGAVEGTVIEMAMDDGKAIVSIQMSSESARKLPLYDDVKIIR
jgi:hypothetical protein